MSQVETLIETTFTVREIDLLHDALVMCLSNFRPETSEQVQIFAEWEAVHDKFDDIVLENSGRETSKPKSYDDDFGGMPSDLAKLLGLDPQDIN